MTIRLDPLGMVIFAIRFDEWPTDVVGCAAEKPTATLPRTYLRCQDNQTAKTR